MNYSKDTPPSANGMSDTESSEKNRCAVCQTELDDDGTPRWGMRSKPGDVAFTCGKIACNRKLAEQGFNS